jgi:hypothetical protein
MKKFIFLSLVASLVIAPVAAWASPGQLDQYGGHNSSDSLYHYHDIPLWPNYYLGSIANLGASYTFYQPKINSAKLISEPVSLSETKLIENPALDVSYCQGKQVFAQGRYDSSNRARVKPVCVDLEQNVFNNKDLTSVNYYKALAAGDGITVNKAYHYRVDNAGKKIITDAPTLSELKGQIIQGATDMAKYFVDNDLQLRAITSWDAQMLKGSDYQSAIAYFDDSIIYSYPIGQLWK